METLPSGLVSVMGGKWTTCRPMAIDTLDAVAKQLDRPLPPAKTLPLLGSDVDPSKTSERLMQQRQQLSDLLPDSPWLQNQIEHLEGNHGLAAAELVNGWTVSQREPLSDVIPICEGELRHAVNAEHAHSVTDLLARRNRLAMVNCGEANRLTPAVRAILEECGRDESSALALDA